MNVPSTFVIKPVGMYIQQYEGPLAVDLPSKVCNFAIRHVQLCLSIEKVRDAAY
jgi:hypothetical protein